MHNNEYHHHRQSFTGPRGSAYLVHGDGAAVAGAQLDAVLGAQLDLQLTLDVLLGKATCNPLSLLSGNITFKLFMIN